MDDLYTVTLTGEGVGNDDNTTSFMDVLVYDDSYEEGDEGLEDELFGGLDYPPDDSLTTYLTSGPGSASFREGTVSTLGSVYSAVSNDWNFGFAKDYIDYLWDEDHPGFNDLNFIPPTEETGTNRGDLWRGDGNGEKFSGGNGHDIILGTVGVDTLNGNRGWDLISTGSGGGTANGGKGNDVMIGGDSRDVLNGDTHNDVLYGFGDDDLIDGGKGDDFASGGGGNDVFINKHGFDVLIGDDGNDIFKIFENAVAYGDSGKDVFKIIGKTNAFGGSGRDKFHLKGNETERYVYGDRGKDTFSIFNGGGTIGDFQPGVDTLKLKGAWDGSEISFEEDEFGVAMIGNSNEYFFIGRTSLEIQTALDSGNNNYLLAANNNPILPADMQVQANDLIELNPDPLSV